MQPIDLHVHSNKSDGTLSPTQLVDYGMEKNLRAFALTDHDTIDGLEEAISYSKDKPIEVIPGIEFSTEHLGKDIHILGLYINYKDPYFLEQLNQFQNSRITRNIKMCLELEKHGVSIAYEKLLETFPNAVITRAHYALYLHQNGYVKAMSDAFDKYIGDHAPCFVPREKVTPEQAVTLVNQNGGIPVLAHPTLYHISDKSLDQLVNQLTNCGLKGIEAVYSTYSPSQEREIKKLAQKYNLCVTGGSDFHGTNKPNLDLANGYGKLFIPETLLDDLLKNTRNSTHKNTLNR